MENKFTPGLWQVKHSESKTAFNVISTVLGGRYKIARCPYSQIEDCEKYNSNEKSEAEANAKLIAAAPELLEALRGLVKDVKSKPNDTRYATHIKIAEASIQKATL